PLPSFSSLPRPRRRRLLRVQPVLDLLPLSLRRVELSLRACRALSATDAGLPSPEVTARVAALDPQGDAAVDVEVGVAHSAATRSFQPAQHFTLSMAPAVGR